MVVVCGTSLTSGIRVKHLPTSAELQVKDRLGRHMLKENSLLGLKGNMVFNGLMCTLVPFSSGFLCWSTLASSTSSPMLMSSEFYANLKLAAVVGIFIL